MNKINFEKLQSSSLNGNTKYHFKADNGCNATIVKQQSKDITKYGFIKGKWELTICKTSSIKNEVLSNLTKKEVNETLYKISLP